jgi:hypothetical protein
MRVLAALLVAGALAVSAAGSQAASQPSVRVKFRTPSGNIGCAGSVAPKVTRLPSSLRCDILSGLRPRPNRSCELDWTGYSFQGRGPARPTCASLRLLVTHDSKAPILAYGKTWKQGPFTCIARRTGLRCTNETGHGFVLARARSRRF